MSYNDTTVFKVALVLCSGTVTGDKEELKEQRVPIVGPKLALRDTISLVERQLSGPSRLYLTIVGSPDSLEKHTVL